MTNNMAKLAQTTYTFVLMNWAAIAGLFLYMRGHQGFWNVASVGTPQRLRRI